MRWADVAAYYTQLRGLLNGDVVIVQDRPCQMLHLDEWGPNRPLPTPLWLAPSGEKGMAVANTVDPAGLLLVQPPAQPLPAPVPAAMLAPGTVLRVGEDHTSPRVIEAAGPWYASLWHAIFEMAPEHVASMPGGQQWHDELRRCRPEDQLHLAVHEGHVSALTARDRDAVCAGGRGILDFGWTGTIDQVRDKAAAAAAMGVTEIAYAPAGPAIVDEMTEFAKAIIG
jgi:5,10-methylenetetrahydromethanopterin reductase